MSNQYTASTKRVWVPNGHFFAHFQDPNLLRKRLGQAIQVCLGALPYRRSSHRLDDEQHAVLSNGRKRQLWRLHVCGRLSRR